MQGDDDKKQNKDFIGKLIPHAGLLKKQHTCVIVTCVIIGLFNDLHGRPHKYIRERESKFCLFFLGWWWCNVIGRS